MRLFRKAPSRVPEIQTISAPDVARMLQRGGDVLVLDVRQPHGEVDFPGKIPGSLRIPPADLPERLEELPRDRLIVPYCT